MREAAEVGTTHLGVPGPPGTPWWVVLPSELPSGTFSAQQVKEHPVPPCLVLVINDNLYGLMVALSYI